MLLFFANGYIIESKNYREGIMDENLQQVYSGLAAHCNKMKEGKYLMSTGTMTSLLRYITSQPALMSCLEKCNYGFRYATELETAMSGGIFKLPLGSKKIVALVTGLLFEMVRGGVNFHNFIKKYYRAATIDMSFDLFVGSVIMPYLMAFRNMLNGEAEEDSSAEDDDDKAVGAGVKEQLLPLIMQFTESVAADNSITDEAREDFYVMLEGLYYSLELSRAKMVKAMFLGLSSVMQDYKDGAAYLRAIKSVLVEYAIV